MTMAESNFERDMRLALAKSISEDFRAPQDLGVKSKSSTFQAKSEEEELQEALFLSALDAQKDAHKPDSDCFDLVWPEDNFATKFESMRNGRRETVPPSAVQPSLNVGEYHASAMTFEAWRSLSLEQRAIQPLGNITLPLSSALEPAPSSTLTYVPCTSPKQFKTSAYNNGFVVGDLNLPVGANYLGARPKSAAVVSGAGPPPLPAVNHLDESGFKRSETVNYQKKNVDEAELIRLAVEKSLNEVHMKFEDKIKLVEEASKEEEERSLKYNGEFNMGHASNNNTSKPQLRNNKHNDINSGLQLVNPNLTEEEHFKLAIKLSEEEHFSKLNDWDSSAPIACSQSSRRSRSASNNRPSNGQIRNYSANSDGHARNYSPKSGGNSPDDEGGWQVAPPIRQRRSPPAAAVNGFQQNVVESSLYNPDGDSVYAAGSLRCIVVDGSNVGYAHTNHDGFSIRGVNICVEYFQKRGHEVVVFLPRGAYNHASQADKDLMDAMEAGTLLKFCPAKSYDDLFTIKFAASKRGIIVSNDQFRDVKEKYRDYDPAYLQQVEKRVLPFVFFEDTFMVADDPFGRGGPSLSQFLKH